MNPEPKIGVYICRCGCNVEGNISATVDVEKLKEAAASMNGVKAAEVYEFVCSNPGQQMIRDGIKQHKLNRIVVAACSPRMHLETFKRNVKQEGLNPYLLEIANIREQCSWIHEDKKIATIKAIDLVGRAVERARNLKPLEEKTVKVNRDALVIGGGIAGINTSIELADKGFQVYLVERGPSVGGHMAQLGKTFPTLDCSSCIITPKMVYVSQHPLIKILSLSEVTKVDGMPGNYKITVTKRPRSVDASKCTACGECSRKCPVTVKSEFEVNMGQRKAIYQPFRQAVPSAYYIDREHCLYFTKGVCKVCQKFCKASAVDFTQQEETVEFNVGAIVVSTGYELLDPHGVKQYSYGLHPDIVTHLQFERLLVQGLHRPSTGQQPKKIAFILCVGSRMTENGIGNGNGNGNGNEDYDACEYCCNIGCMNAIKEAYVFQKEVPDAEPWVFYTDIRAHGKGYEEFYARLRNHGVRFIRGRAAEVVPHNGSLRVRAADTLLGMPIEEDFDMVVLSAGLTASKGTNNLARMVGIHTGSDGFFLERHHKLRPVDTQREGIYACGCALGPKDIRETITESMAASSHVASFLGKGEVSVSSEVAILDDKKCDGCEKCIQICPARAVVKTSDKQVEINPMSCVGCGICIPVCPKNAIDLNHNTEAQLMGQIRGNPPKDDLSPKIVAFIEKNTAYAAADLAGQTRSHYGANVRIVSVPSVGRVGLKHMLQAFAAGADGVALIEGEDSPFTGDKVREHLTRLKKELQLYGVESLRLVSTTTTIPQYPKMVEAFEVFNSRLFKMGPVSPKVRSEIETKLKELQ